MNYRINYKNLVLGTYVTNKNSDSSTMMNHNMLKFVFLCRELYNPKNLFNGELAREITKPLSPNN